MEERPCSGPITHPSSGQWDRAEVLCQKEARRARPTLLFSTDFIENWWPSHGTDVLYSTFYDLPDTFRPRFATGSAAGTAPPGTAAPLWQPLSAAIFAAPCFGCGRVRRWPAASFDGYPSSPHAAPPPSSGGGGAAGRL